VAPYTTASSTKTVNSANATFAEARAIITRK
jgi:hypothetical protein